MPKCDFNKVAYFRTPFPKNTSRWLLLPIVMLVGLFSLIISDMRVKAIHLLI